MPRRPSVATLYLIAVRKADISTAAVAVAAMLYTYMRPDGCAWPSIATLAADAKLSTRHTRRAIRELEAAGLLDVAGRAGRPSTYLATPDPELADELDAAATSDTGVRRSASERSDTQIRQVGHPDPRTRTRMSAELVSELVHEQKDARTPARDAAANGDAPAGYADPASAELAKAAAREARRRLGARRAGDHETEDPPT